jgi:hypothetical protein
MAGASRGGPALGERSGGTDRFLRKLNREDFEDLKERRDKGTLAAPEASSQLRLILVGKACIIFGFAGDL